MRFIIVAILLTGCATKQPEPITPPKIENKEKDKYIEKVEAVVSDSASALTAVVPVLDKGTVREVVEAQVTRLSGVAKPDVKKVQEFTRIISQNDTKAIEKDKKKAEKVEEETNALYDLVMQKDFEISEAYAKADAEFKQKILWQYSTAGLGIFVAGLLAMAFTPFKKSAGITMAGGMLAMASSWIFDSTWFMWIVGGAIATTTLCILYSILRPRPKEPSQEI
jgi:hypothetical protein